MITLLLKGMNFFLIYIFYIKSSVYTYIFFIFIFIFIIVLSTRNVRIITLNLLHVVFLALPSNYKAKYLVSPIRIQFYFPNHVDLQVPQVDLVVDQNFMPVPLSTIHPL